MNDLGFDVDDLYYMTADEYSAGDWHGDDSCRVKKAVTSEEIKAGIDCAITYAAQRMSLELSGKKANQKKELLETKHAIFGIKCTYLEGLMAYCLAYWDGRLGKSRAKKVRSQFEDVPFYCYFCFSNII